MNELNIKCEVDHDLYIKMPYLYYLMYANKIGLLNTLDFHICYEKLLNYINMYENGNDFSKYYLKCLLAYECKYEIEDKGIKLPENYATCFNGKYRYHNDDSFVDIGEHKFNIGFSENSISIPLLQRELTKFNIEYDIFESKNSLFTKLIQNMKTYKI